MTRRKPHFLGKVLIAGLDDVGIERFLFRQSFSGLFFK